MKTKRGGIQSRVHILSIIHMNPKKKFDKTVRTLGKTASYNCLFLNAPVVSFVYGKDMQIR